jgi:phosphate butyryltransferase
MIIAVPFLPGTLERSPMIRTLSEIVDLVRSRDSKTLSVACGEDPHTIEAVGKAVRDGIVKAVLTGSRDRILETAAEREVDSSLFEIEDHPDAGSALRAAIANVRDGKCDFLMKGLVDSSAYMRGILAEEHSADILSHVSLIELPTYPKLLAVSDIAVIPCPDLKQKTAMLRYAIDVARRLGNERPLASIVCAVEKVNPKMPCTVDAAVLAKMAERGQIRGAVVDGPLSLDVSVSPECRDIKGVRSEVAGQADILIFPNIEAGNVFFKTATQLANGEIAAVVTGAFCPAILTSRADSEQSKFYSIALGALLAHSD